MGSLAELKETVANYGHWWNLTGGAPRPEDVSIGLFESEEAPLGVRSSRLEDLYVRFGGDAIRLAYLLTGNVSLAEDIVQDAFVRLAGRLAHIRDPEAFESYLRRTVVNLANSHFRRRAVERRYVEREEGLARHESIDQDVDARQDLWREMEKLSPRQRAAIVLRFYEDLSERRVADALGCRPGTVKSLVARGLATLRAASGEALTESSDEPGRSKR